MSAFVVRTKSTNIAATDELAVQQSEHSEHGGAAAAAAAAAEEERELEKVRTAMEAKSARADTLIKLMQGQNPPVSCSLCRHFAICLHAMQR